MYGIIAFIVVYVILRTMGRAARVRRLKATVQQWEEGYQEKIDAVNAMMESAPKSFKNN